jgi:hypothetical protein
MEDDLKNMKLDFLSNHWVDHNKILNVTSGDQNKAGEGFHWRQPQRKTTSMEDDFNNLKLDFLSNRCVNLKQILNLTWGGDQTKTDEGFNWRRP